MLERCIMVGPQVMNKLPCSLQCYKCHLDCCLSSFVFTVQVTRYVSPCQYNKPKLVVCGLQVCDMLKNVTKHFPFLLWKLSLRMIVNQQGNMDTYCVQSSI